MNDNAPSLPPPLPAMPATTPLAAPLPEGWQPLPPRAGGISAIGSSITMGLILTVTAVAATFSWESDYRFAVGALAALLGFGGGAWLAWRRHKLTFWQLDEQGLALRIGHLWLTETRVPMSRVQHLDLRRGPLQRMANLATLVVHTAGSRHSAVAVPNLDMTDAERLRDRLAHQLDHDDAL